MKQAILKWVEELANSDPVTACVSSIFRISTSGFVSING
jgi:hypothetical protein